MSQLDQYTRCRRAFLPAVGALTTAVLLTAIGCATAPSFERSTPVGAGGDAGQDAPQSGVLVMAHGGGAEWNAAVDDALAPLRDRVPLVLALGMADPRTLQAGLDSLTAQGVGHVAVVRLFVSEDAFLHQTEYVLGLRSDPPPKGIIGHRIVPGTQLRQVATKAAIMLDRSGLAGSSAVAGILQERAAHATSAGRSAGLLLVAHGLGDEEANQRLLDAMEGDADGLRAAGHAEVRTATLREDWAEARAAAEGEIRAMVEEMGERRGRVVVLPYRLYGFGPYAGVLDGLAYDRTSSLLPHRMITEWIAEQATERFCSSGLPSPLAPCRLADDRREGTTKQPIQNRTHKGF